jgi:Family of unknown function (DUF6644)
VNGALHLYQFASWLDTTPIHAWARSITAGTDEVALLAVQVTHVLTVCVIAGSAGIFSLRMMGVIAAGQPLAVVARRLLPWAWGAITLQILTGGFMVLDRPERAMDSLTFPYKMGFLILAIALTAAFGITLRRDPHYWDEDGNHRLAARVLGALSLLLWIGVIFGGRWIAYEQVPA